MAFPSFLSSVAYPRRRCGRRRVCRAPVPAASPLWLAAVRSYSKDHVQHAADEEGQFPVGDFDQASAAELFEQTCSQCHELDEVDAFPLFSHQDVRDLLSRMVDNGLDVTESELDQIAWYLGKTRVD